jgi:PAS domain-containing protein
MSDNQMDISALQSENAALRQRVADLESTAARLRTLFSMWDDILMVIDKDGRYLEVAPSLLPLVASVDPEVFIGKTMHELLPADVADPSEVREELAVGLRKHGLWQGQR